jgi:hypothetical protein
MSHQFPFRLITLSKLSGISLLVSCVCFLLGSLRYKLSPIVLVAG